jgi:hypothetical protein
MSTNNKLPVDRKLGPTEAGFSHASTHALPTIAATKKGLYIADRTE